MTMDERITFLLDQHKKSPDGFIAVDVDVVTGETTRLDGGAVEVNDYCQHLTGGTADGGRLIFTSGSTAYRHLVMGVNINGWTDCHNGGVEVCTQGFTAKVGSYEGYITSGHCFGNASNVGTNRIWTSMYASNMSWPYAKFRFHNEADNFNDDVQFNREVYGSNVPENRVYRDEESGFVAITSHATGTLADNTPACVKGASGPYLGWGLYAPSDDTQGYRCGLVTDPMSTATGDHNPLNWAKLEIGASYISTDRLCVDGDSGGPVWSLSGNKALGIVGLCYNTIWTSGGYPGMSYVYFEMADAVEAALGAQIVIG